MKVDIPYPTQKQAQFWNENPNPKEPVSELILMMEDLTQKLNSQVSALKLLIANSMLDKAIKTSSQNFSVEIQLATIELR